MKVVCPPIASTQQLLTMLMLYICYVEKQKYKPLKKNFLFLQFYPSSITKLQNFHTKVWLNIKKNIYIQSTKPLFTSVRSAKPHDFTTSKINCPTFLKASELGSSLQSHLALGRKKTTQTQHTIT